MPELGFEDDDQVTLRHVGEADALKDQALQYRKSDEIPDDEPGQEVHQQQLLSKDQCLCCPPE